MKINQKRILFYFLLLLFCYNRADSQEINNLGIPYIKNYSSEEFHASDQNWAIYQAHSGIMYFGNTLGILEFDGMSWRLIRLPNNSAVRSITEGNDGRIYVGGSNELGYLDSDPAGKTIFKSLLNLIPAESGNFADVWDIYKLNNETVFRTYKFLFIIKNGKFSAIRAQSRFRSAGLVRGVLFVLDNGKTFTLQEDKLIPYETANLQIGLRTLILPFDKDKILFATRENGLFIQNQNEIIPWKTSVDEFLRKYLIYSALQIDSNYYAIGTWLNGVIIIDKYGKPIQYLNKEKGLLNNSVYSLFVDREKNLWCAMDGGISRIEINSPFSYFNSNAGFEAQCYTAALFKNKLYIGGGPNVYYHDWFTYENPLQRKPFIKIDQTSPQLWQLKEIQGKLYAAHSFDILILEENKVERIALNDGIVWSLTIPKNNTSLLLAGEDDGIYVLEQINKIWKFRNKIRGENLFGRWLVEDEKNNLWCSGYDQRIFKYRVNKNFDSIISVKFYDIRANYPLAVGNRLTILKNKIIVSGADGFYEYDENSDRFIPSAELNEMIVKGKPVNINGADSKGDIWFNDFEGQGVFLKQPNGHYKVFRTPFYKFNLAPESFPVVSLNDFSILLCKNDGFINYNPKYIKNYDLDFNTLIRKVVLLNNDSVIWDGGNTAIREVRKDELQNIILSYEDNAIHFEYAAPLFENIEKTQFQFKLEGYDKGWSSWSSSSIKEYTNLQAGKYTFTVRARNVFRVIGKTSQFSFRVKAPWFLSIWAWLGYFIITSAIVYGIVFINSRRLRSANLRLEKVIELRTIEIMNQKEIIQLHFDQLKDADALKDKFYSIISHDLINTIGSIKSWSELLYDYMHDKDDDKLKLYGNALSTTSKSAFELLTNLLNWTRLQTGRMKLNRVKFDLIEIIDEVTTLYQNIIENKGLNLSLSLPDELFIFADKNMISTVIRNLLSNAIKFTPESGTISIEVSNSASEYSFVITDSGLGINSEDLKKLFRKDIYFQKHGTNNESGTGLGLLLIKDFIEMHKGTISIKSEAGKGSKFTFTVPIGL